MEKILITGGAGFIGSNLALTLLKRGHQVTVLDNLSEQIHGKNPEETSPLYLSIKDKVHFIKGTVACRETLQKAIADNTVIVHLAAETGTGQSMYEIQHYTDVNIGATALLLDILTNEKHSVKKVVVASSRAIYGEGKYYNKTKNTFVYPLQRIDEDMQKGDFEVKDPQNHSDVLELVATTEDAIIHPTSVYGITKQVQEQLVMTVCPTIGIAGVAFRYQNVYGPGQSLKNPYTGILSIFSTQIKNGNGINIFEDGKETRDFVFISDVVDATVLGIEKETANNQVFNVGTGTGSTVLEVIQSFERVSGKKLNYQIVGRRAGDITAAYANTDKANKVLGWKAQSTLDDAMRSAWQWEQKVRSEK